MKVLTRPRAAAYLTEQGIETTAQGLADRACDGTGPAYTIINGRACYTPENLDRWIAEQAARPLTRRKRRPDAEGDVAPAA